MKPLRYLILIVALVVSAMAPCLSVYGQDTRAQESRKARLEKEIRIINEQLAKNSSQSNTALNDLSLVRHKISMQNELIAEADKALKAIEDSISRKQERIDEMQRRLDTLSVYYSKLIRGAYKNRDNRTWYMYIMASSNLGQAFRRVGYLRSLSVRMNQQAKRIAEVKKELEKENQDLLSLRADARAQKAEREKAAASLRQEESRSRNLVASLQKDRKKYQNEIARKRRQVEDLNREIEKIIREAASGGTSKTKNGKTSVDKTKIDYKLDNEFASNKGKLPWPANGPIVEQFGQHYHPVYKNVRLPFSNGVTIALAPGTKVKAVFDGVVKQIVVMPGYNKCVLVAHGTYFSFYCKLANVSVKAGDKVKTGDVLGTVDTIDGQTQLHLQIWKGTKPQNPELWLRP